MKNTFLASCLLLAGCSTAPPPPTPQQAAVAAYIRMSLPDSSSYQPVSWGKMTPYRASEAAAADLAEGSQAYVAATAKLKHDSTSYVLMSSAAKEVPVSDQDLAQFKRFYQAALTDRNLVVSKLRHASATKDDTTRLGYQLAHVFRAKTEKGQLLLDSAGFLINAQGVVLPSRQPHHFPFYTDDSKRDFFMGMPLSPPPSPPPLAPPTPSEVRAYLKAPMER